MSHPQQKFAVFDIDGTLIRWQITHAVFDYLGRQDRLAPGEYDLLLAARRVWKTRKSDESFKAYEMELIGIIERNLISLAVDHFNEAVEYAFKEYRDQVYRYTRDLIADLKQQGYALWAISGSPREIVAMLADYYGFDDFVGTDHIQQDGAFTGEIMVAAQHKPELLRGLMKKHGLGFEGSIGVGDSEGDITMLGLVENPIAFNPSKQLFREAQARGWKVIIERKNMIYELESVGDHYKLAGTNA